MVGDHHSTRNSIEGSQHEEGWEWLFSWECCGINSPGSIELQSGLDHWSLKKTSSLGSWISLCLWRRGQRPEPAFFFVLLTCGKAYASLQGWGSSHLFVPIVASPCNLFPPSLWEGARLLMASQFWKTCSPCSPEMLLPSLCGTHLEKGSFSVAQWLLGERAWLSVTQFTALRCLKMLLQIFLLLFIPGKCMH